jgi:D-cysteine desulfhydrase
MRTILVLAPQPETGHVRAQLARLRASGAELHFARGLATSYLLAAWLMASRIRPAGGTPYPIPPGGSNALGALGYVEAALELADQVAREELPEPSHVVVPLGSGGTAAGLLAGLRLAALRSRLVCVLVSDVAPMGPRRVARLAGRALAMLRRHGVEANGPDPSPADLDVEHGWLGAGYGRATPEGERAADLLRDREGVELDPVYTCKAVAAMCELNRRGAFGPGPVLYWHTYSPPTPGGTRQ